MGKIDLSLTTWIIFLIAALLEVGGDALIRKGLKGTSVLWIVIGGLVLAGYGLVVNTVKWDFSRLLGVYVAVFAVISVLCGQVIFKENIPLTTWLGLSIIVIGGLIIQFGAVR